MYHKNEMCLKNEQPDRLSEDHFYETTPLISKAGEVNLNEKLSDDQSLDNENLADAILYYKNIEDENIEDEYSDDEISEKLEPSVDVTNAKRVYEELIGILEKLENNTNNSIALLIPVNTATSIFPEFVSAKERLSSSAASALAVSFANALIAVWENYDEQNKLPQKCCSFKTLVDFIKSPIGAPVCSYTMLLCFKTLGEFAPQLPDNTAMLSLIGSLFAVSLINGVLTQLGTNSEVNPQSKITRRDIANGIVSGVTAAGFIAQIDRILKMNMDPITYETFGPYMLPLEAAIGLAYGMARILIPALIKSNDNGTNDRDIALSMMNSTKKNWDNFNKHVRFVGNAIYISGLAIESTMLLDLDCAVGVVTAVLGGPIVATSIDGIVSHCCKQPKVSSLITSRAINSPVFGGPINNSNESTQEQCLTIEDASKLV